MNVVVFRVTEAERVWYVWPRPSPRLYFFPSDVQAQRFARQWADSHGGTFDHMKRTIEQVASLI